MTCSSPRGCYGNTVPWLKADMIVNRRDSSERCWLPGTEAGGVAPASHCFRAGRPARHSSRRRLARTPGRAWSWLAARNGGGCTSSGRPEIQQSFSVPSQRATALRSAQPRPGRWPFRTAGRRGGTFDLHQRKLFGQIMVRHMCATGDPSNPSPSEGCRKLRPTTSSNSSNATLTLESKLYTSFIVIKRAVIYHR